MHEKVRRRYPEQRTAGAGASAPGAYPARFHQSVDGTLADRDPAYPFDHGAGDRLVVGDHREGLDRRARQFSGNGSLDTQFGGEIGGRAKRPAAGEPDEVYAAPGIVRGELFLRSALAATFAATLELARRGRIELRQDRTFGPIYLRSPALAGDGTPV